jgi:hypothetical protein
MTHIIRIILISAFFAANLTGCAAAVSRDRILLDAQNELHKRAPGARVVEADMKDRVEETPSLISAQVLLTVEAEGQATRFVRYHFKLIYQKLESGWELVKIEKGM